MATVKDTFEQRMFNSESSGNPNASVTIDDGRTFAGLGGMGKARLSEVGMGTDFTWEEYLADPSIQKMAFRRHIADYNNRIDRDGLLAKYTGEVGGVAINRDALLGMAHLGGYGGMNKFLQSGGRYNPSDKFGTNLAKYGKKFGLSYGGEDDLDAEPADMPKDRLRFGKDVPSYDDPRENPREGDNDVFDRLQHMQMMSARSSDDLRAFANNMGQAVDRSSQQAVSPLNLDMGAPVIDPRTGTAVPAGSPDQKAAATAAALQQGGAAPGSPDQKAAATAAALQQGGAAPGSPDQKAAATAAALQQGSIKPDVTPAAGGGGGGTGGAPFTPDMGTPNTRVSTRNDPTPNEGDEKQGFLDRLSGALFKNAEDPRQKFSDVMMGLSRGLGQMSHGQPVDLSSVMNRIQARSAQAAQSKRDAFNQNMQMQRVSMEAERLEMDRNQMAYKRLQDEADAQNEAVPFSEAQLEEWAQNPRMKNLVDMVRSPNKKAREVGLQGLKEVMAKDAADGAVDPNKFAKAYTVMSDPDASREEIAGAIAGMDPEDVVRLTKLPGIDKTAFQKNSAAYQDAVERGDVAAQRAMEDVWRRGAGGGETPNQARAREQAYKTGDDMHKSMISRRDMALELERMRATTERMILNGEESSAIDKMLSTGLGLYRQAFGADAAAEIEAATGVDVGNLQSLETSEETLALMIAKPMMQGQGTVTDGERKKLLAVIAGGGTDHATRMTVLNKLSALNSIDRAIANDYNDYISSPERHGEDLLNARQHQQAIENAGMDVAAEVIRANDANTHIEFSGKSGFPELSDLSVQEYAEKVAAHMTPSQFSLFRESLPTVELKDGGGKPVLAKLWKTTAEDGTETIMVYNPSTGNSTPAQF